MLLLIASQGEPLQPLAGRGVNGSPIRTELDRAFGLSVLFEFDYLIVERAKICGGWSRHWVVAWLWFLS
ncbi:hypothetical protein E6P78_10985 [Streptomyces sp. A0958]|uniref:hypothetical protein n=1 Tax=Streptomyces sp. A0958 TaxID=2563101 RepID=UPI00109E6555|nr:hypothetical protein [Streptomyces sp. A0958]THA69962.1 hypothetical protein E6P78_10985 [Streptomyces sp. A0958]